MVKKLVIFINLLWSLFIVAESINCYVCTNNKTFDYSIVRVSDKSSKDDCENQQLIDCDRGEQYKKFNKNLPNWTCQTFVHQTPLYYIVAKGCLMDSSYQTDECNKKLDGVNTKTLCSCTTNGCNEKALSEQTLIYNQKTLTNDNIEND